MAAVKVALAVAALAADKVALAVAALAADKVALAVAALAADKVALAAAALVDNKAALEAAALVDNKAALEAAALVDNKAALEAADSVSKVTFPISFLRPRFSTMSISFRLRPTTLLVAGSLLVPCAAFAQDGALSIVPTDNALSPVPAPVTSPQSAPLNTQPILDITFKDVSITQLLDVLATQFDLSIVVDGEIASKIGFINLKGKTAEQALDAVIRAGRLSCKKQADGTYIISKPDPLAATPVQSTETSAFPPALPSITPNNGFSGGMNSGNSALQGFGGPRPENVAVPMDDEPSLDEMTSSSDTKVRTFPMRILNVKPSLLAYWLDPSNNPEPIDLRQAKQAEAAFTNHQLSTQMVGPGNSQFSASGVNGFGGNGQGFDTQGIVPNNFTGNPYLNSNAQVRTYADAQIGRNNNNNNQQNGRGGNGRGGAGGGGTFQLPEGVDRIVAVDPQNVLLVSGTPEGVAKLRQTIGFLDRPLRQVEIEAQFLSITTNAAREFGLDFSSARGNVNASTTGSATSVAAGGLQVGFIRGNFQAAIIAAERSGRAKTLTAPRVLAINNLPATLTQSLNTPIILTQTNTAVGNAVATQTNQNLVFITTQTTLNVTPTINNDDTITVLMQPQISSPIGTPNALGASAIATQTLQTIANVRDGETIALGGLRTKNISVNRTKIPLISDIPFIGKLFRSRTNSEVETELIIFLTARIVRRVGDDDAAGAIDLQGGIGG